MTDATPDFRYKRVLLKVSGEVLMGDQAYGIDTKTVDVVAAAVAAVARQGVEKADTPDFAAEVASMTGGN